MVCPGGRKAGPLIGSPTRITWKGRKQSPEETKGERAVRDIPEGHFQCQGS